MLCPGDDRLWKSLTITASAARTFCSNGAWRLLDTGSLDAATNIAMDASLLELKAQALIPDTLRVMSFSSPAALLGRHQSPRRELRLDYCRSNNIEINRRITGGGAIYLDAGQIGWELIASRASIPAGAAMADLTAFICETAATALRQLGIDAAFRPRNDIEVGGRKICGTGGAFEGEAFLFQGTLLVDFDPEVMIKALRVPVEKLLPRELSSARERVTCLSAQMEKVPDRRQIMQAFAKAFSAALGVELREAGLSEVERVNLERLIPEYRNGDWLWQEDAPDDGGCLLRSVHRGSGGVIRAAASVDSRRGIIKSVHFTGDYFIDPSRAAFDLEASLRDCHLDRYHQRIEDFFNDSGTDCLGLGAPDFDAALTGALAKLLFKGTEIGPEEADCITLVGSQDISEVIEAAQVLLLPYCAKPPDCEYRSLDACDECGQCSVGEAYRMAAEHGIRVVSVNDYEHLQETLESIRQAGVQAYIGCCCHAFMVKRYRSFQDAGMEALLIDIEDTTCYELSREQEAYRGDFDEQTELKLGLLEKILRLRAKGEPARAMIASDHTSSIECEVLVIGAGPAGTVAAATAAAAGADVVLLDRKSKIGRPVQCAGLVPAPAGRFIERDSGAVVATVAALRTVYPDGFTGTTDAPGFLLDRELFDLALAERARSAGVRVICGYRASPDDHGAVAISSGGERLDISAQVIVGADGPRSATGRLIGSINQVFVHAIQKTFKRLDGQPQATVFFDRKLAGGYGWLFPAGDELRLGVGLAPGSGISLRQALEYFIEKASGRGLVAGAALDTGGGLVPAGGPVHCQRGNVILAGDAAGLCNALTGAGIMSALISGELAGEAAALAVSGAGMTALEGYAKEIGSLLGESHARFNLGRRWMSGRWNQGDAGLSRDLRKVWPASAEYEQLVKQEVEVSRA